MKFKILLLVLLIAIVFSNCTSSKKLFCGCPNENGLVGYK